MKAFGVVGRVADGPLFWVLRYEGSEYSVGWPSLSQTPPARPSVR